MIGRRPLGALRASSLDGQPEQPCYLDVPILAREVAWCLAVRVACRGIGMVLQEDPNEICVTPKSSLVQGSESVLLRDVR